MATRPKPNRGSGATALERRRANSAGVPSARREHRPASRHGPRRARPNYPFTFTLPDGRTLCLEVPGRWTTDVPGYGLGFLPEAVRLIDRVCAVHSAIDSTSNGPSPGFIATLREALGMTQREFGGRIGVDKMTVARWEWGKVRPSVESIAAMERLRKEAIRKGVVVS